METAQQVPPAPAPSGSGAEPGVDTAVSVRELRQNFGTVQAVRDVSFDVARGEVFALLGTNGAGKTTTVETLEGFRRPSGGQVRVFGANPYGQPARLRGRTNAVLQNSGVFPELTVAETVDLARDLCDDPRPRGRTLEMVGLTDRASAQVRSLSGGEKRRLDLALAVLTRPEALFLDEPTTGMDPEGRRDLWDLVSGLREENVAVLLTTHYLEEAERLADRLAIMHHGAIREEGRLADVLSTWGDRIGFRMPDHLRLADLPELPGAEAEVDVRGGEPWARYTVTGEDGDGRAHRAMAALLEWADRTGTTLGRLELRTASLEDVFLSIADDTAGPASQ
ncbi:ABC-2 type transport system ATP-binding protein [Haloactinospora alba]|uniref:ABC-2 type transport system ATP-binding protein n=1 Tax=Haloactinospora alba TaxID=405555 RepID=A0A543N7C6_9ACTN|nr:ABC transporter ATP-binding protein [Haloactinospora alba]TQN27732.1 ABC-2 type transport system ATP-binding protein [Haloactinospora alba]